MSYDTYNVFYYVFKFKSITLAANYLKVSQPAVTKHIKKLEDKLGYKLFIRTKKGLSLTFEGEKLYEEVSKAIEIFNMIESENNGSKPIKGGTIRIISGYATTKNILLPIILEFNKIYPDVKVLVEYNPIKEAIEKLKNGEVDLLFMNDKVFDEYTDISFTPFYELHDILVVNKEIKDLFPSSINLKDLHNYPIIYKNYNTLKKFIIENNLKLKSICELTDYWLIETYIKMNMGLGIVSKEFVKEDLEKQNLIEIKTDIKFPKREISYALRKNSVLRPELTKLIDLFSKNKKEVQK